MTEHRTETTIDAVISSEPIFADMLTKLENPEFFFEAYQLDGFSRNFYEKLVGVANGAPT